MNKPKLYRQYNQLQRQDAEEAIDDFFAKYQFTEDGTENYLDIGCGTGDVMLEIFLPKIQQNYKKFVGIDISAEMINYCKENFENDKICFEKFDITDKIPSTSIMNNLRFDCVTSFYCFHWIQDLRKALRNVHTLLKSDGVCLLVFLAYCPVFDTYLKLSKMEKYTNYYRDVNKFIPRLQFDDDPKKTFNELLREVGFRSFTINVHEKVFIYDDANILKESMRAVNPFVKKMPKHLQEDNLNDLANVLDGFKLSGINWKTGQTYYRVPHKLMVVTASK